MSIDLEKLAALNPDEVFDFINGITDQQAEDSDIGGESDAEDNVIFATASNESDLTDSIRPNSSSTVETSTSIASGSRFPRRVKRKHSPDTDYDSDDSIDDPDFSPVGKTRLGSYIISDEDDIESTSDAEELLQASTTVAPTTASFKWSKNIVSQTEYTKSNFAEPFGAKISINVESPIDIFISLFDQVLFRIIIIESNRYAEQKGVKLDLSVDELKAFFGILIIMGFNRLPSLRLYWSSDINFYSSRISDVMPLKRFLKILRFLHLNDNDKMPKKGELDFDKLYKVQPLISILKTNFLNSFNPSRNVSVDESMVAFKGRTSLKQYMPLKPIKRGLKIWAMACSKTGYLLNFSVYEGKRTSEEEGPLGEKTVLELTTPLRGKSYCVYFDNFFTSFSLLTKMLDHRLFSCGTMRVNRKHFPASELLPDKSLQAGQSDSVWSKS